MSDIMEFRAPYIETQFKKFAHLISNGRGSEALIADDPQLYLQMSQAFSTAFLLGYRFGEHVGEHESSEIKDEIARDLSEEAQFLSHKSREIAMILGVRTRNTREMRK